MFSGKANYLKLRTNLRLCINRLKLLEKKKTELALKARREISDYIANGKEDRARIRVEHIIREDYLVEAMEIVEMLCDLLLARFGLIEKMAELDPGLEEAISTLIWVTPRLSADVQELKEVARQLTMKYGKEYGEMCRTNGFHTVNEKVLHKLSFAAPPKILVENYMIEIARSYKVPFDPDPLVMSEKPPETDDLIELGIDMSQPGVEPKSVNRGSGGGHRGGGGHSGGGGGSSGGGGSGGGGYSKQREAEGQCRQSLPPSYTPSDGGFNTFSAAGGGGQRAGAAAGASTTGWDLEINGITGPRTGSNDIGTGRQMALPGGAAAATGVGPSQSNFSGFNSGALIGGEDLSNAMPMGPAGGLSPGGTNSSRISPSGTPSGGMSPGGIQSGGLSPGGMPSGRVSPRRISSGGMSPGGYGSSTGGQAAGGTGGFVPGMGAGLGGPGDLYDSLYHNPLAGGVPVLPTGSDHSFPDPIPPGQHVPPPMTLLPDSNHQPRGSSPSHCPPPLPDRPPNAGMPGQPGLRADSPVLPLYDDVMRSPNHYPPTLPRSGQPASVSPPRGPANNIPDIPVLPDVPGLPSVPMDPVGGTSAGGDDVDFDDLTRRFEELKRRK